MTPDAKAKIFGIEFVPPLISRSTRVERLQMRNLHKDIRDHAASDNTYIPPEVVDIALKSLKKGKAAGPDNIDAEQLLAADTNMTDIISKILNAQLKSGQIPSSLKRSHIVPILKSDKPACIASSYRPINLVSPLSKCFEKAIIMTIEPQLLDMVQEEQFAYCRGRAADMMILNLQQDIIAASKRGEHSLLIQLDLKRAFESLCHQNLIRKLLSNKAIPGRIIRWINSFITGRYSKVIVKDGNAYGESNWRKVGRGIPQGSVVGPYLVSTLHPLYKL